MIIFIIDIKNLVLIQIKYEVKPLSQKALLTKIKKLNLNILYINI